MKQPYKVHMLPTDQPTELGIRNGHLYIYHPAVAHEGQYLYCTSDESKKIDQWIISLEGTLYQATIMDADDIGQVVVATSDPKLWEDELGWNKLIPKIPLSMIQAYVTSPFDEVMLELPDVNPKGTWNNMPLKLNSAGEVIWSLKEERMYTRAEVILILRRAKIWMDAISFPTEEDINKWFDKQYPI